MQPPFLSTSEARKQLSSLVNQVKYQQKSFTIGRHGSADAILAPIGVRGSVLHEPSYRSLKSLAKKNHLSLIILFGSHAKGHARPDSDLDIAIYPEKDVSFKHEQELYDELTRLFQCDDIDLVNIKKAHSVLLEYEIFYGGKVLYQKSREFYMNEKLRAFFKYQDFKYYHDQFGEALMRKLNNLTQK